jgi:hypothetical protein
MVWRPLDQAGALGAIDEFHRSGWRRAAISGTGWPRIAAAVCALLQTRTDCEGWQGASRLRAAGYLIYADGDFAATGDTERPVPGPSRSRSG